MRINFKYNSVEIALHSGDVVFIDRCDLELFAKYAWYPVLKKGSRTKYLVRNGVRKTRTHSFHAHIMSAPEGMEIDHINQNGLDNRRSNLRIVTHRQNMMNRPKNISATSKYWGVYWQKEKNKWAAQAELNGSRRTICVHKDEDAAARIRENWIIQNSSNSKRNFA